MQRAGGGEPIEEAVKHADQKSPGTVVVWVHFSKLVSGGRRDHCGAFLPHQSVVVLIFLCCLPLCKDGICPLINWRSPFVFNLTNQAA